MNRRMLKMLLNGVLCAFLAACGGGGGGGSPSAQAVIPSTTKLLDSSSTSKVAAVSSDQSTITFSGTSSGIASLKTGDSLILGVTQTTPKGLLRKINGVQTNPDGTVTVSTEATSLEAVVQSGSFSEVKNFGDADVVNIQVLDAGVTLSNSAAKQTAKQTPLQASLGKFSLNLKDVVLYDGNGNPNNQIKVSGTIKLNPSVNADLIVDNYKLKKFSMSLTAAEDANLTITAGAFNGLLDKKKKIATYDLGSSTFWIPAAPLPIPVVITYTLDVYVGINGSVSEGITANVSQTASVTGGAQYLDGTWSPISSSSVNFGFQPPTLSLAMDGKCYIGPEISTELYGVAGPLINIFGYFQLQADLLKDPWWELFGGLEGNVGAKIDMLSGRITARYDAKFLDYKKTIAQASTAASTGSITGSW